MQNGSKRENPIAQLPCSGDKMPNPDLKTPLTISFHQVRSNLKETKSGVHFKENHKGILDRVYAIVAQGASPDIMLPPCFNYLDAVNSWRCVTKEVEPNQLLDKIERYWEDQDRNNPALRKMAKYVVFLKEDGQVFDFIGLEFDELRDDVRIATKNKGKGKNAKTMMHKLVLEIRSHNAKSKCLDDHLADVDTAKKGFKTDQLRLQKECKGKSPEAISQLESFNEFYEKYFNPEQLPTGFKYPVIRFSHKYFPIPNQLGFMANNTTEAASRIQVSDIQHAAHAQPPAADTSEEIGTQVELVLSTHNAGHLRFAQPGHLPQTALKDDVIRQFLLPKKQE